MIILGGLETFPGRAFSVQGLSSSHACGSDQADPTEEGDRGHRCLCGTREGRLLHMAEVL